MSVRYLAWVGFVAVGLNAIAGRPAMAQDASGETTTQVIEAAAAVTTAPMAVAAVPMESTRRAEIPMAELSPGRRPSWFLPIHVFSVVVQGLDAHSTLDLLRHRPSDSNPLYQHMSSNKVAFLAVKAGVAAAVVYATDKLSRRHRVGAVVAAAAVNSVYLTIAANNYRSVRATEGKIGR